MVTLVQDLVERRQALLDEIGCINNKINKVLELVSRAMERKE